MSDVFIPKGGAGRLPIQACSRMPAPERGFGFQEGAYHNVTPLELGTTCVAKVTEQTLLDLEHDGFMEVVMAQEAREYMAKIIN